MVLGDVIDVAIIYSLLEIPAHSKNLPYCTTGYETWTIHHASRTTGATFIEIAVCADSTTRHAHA